MINKIKLSIVIVVILFINKSFGEDNLTDNSDKSSIKKHAQFVNSDHELFNKYAKLNPNKTMSIEEFSDYLNSIIGYFKEENDKEPASVESDREHDHSHEKDHDHGHSHDNDHDHGHDTER